MHYLHEKNLLKDEDRKGFRFAVRIGFDMGLLLGVRDVSMQTRTAGA